MTAPTDDIRPNCILGLTGGIGCGKTTATNHLAKKGVHIVDADLVARQVVEIGSLGLQKLVTEFGEDILNLDNSLNRAKLRQIAFSSNELKEKLNSILHPLIRKEMMNQLNMSKSDYSVLSAPLLFENNLHQLTNYNALIDLPEELQIERTIKRDKHSDESTIRNIINAQMSRANKIKLADIVIDNSKDVPHLIRQIDNLHNKMLEISEKSH